jgi:hypothetical protein
MNWNAAIEHFMSRAVPEALDSIRIPVDVTEFVSSLEVRRLFQEVGLCRRRPNRRIVLRRQRIRHNYR